jgi:hypothetical protein
MGYQAYFYLVWVCIFHSEISLDISLVCGRMGAWTHGRMDARGYWGNMDMWLIGNIRTVVVVIKM